MPENTLAGWETKIRAYADSNNVTLARTLIRRAAKMINKRFEQFHASLMTDVEIIGYVLQHSDPTGETAVENVMAERAEQNKANAARRLAA